MRRHSQFGEPEKRIVKLRNAPFSGEAAGAARAAETAVAYAQRR
jgi:hypothetical protein